MSSNGEDDDSDDIDKVVEALQETNSSIQGLSDRLDRLFESIQRGVEEDTGQELPGPEGADLWDVGMRSPGKASTPDEYIELRRETARYEEVSVPQVARDAPSLDKFFFEVYIRNGEHLQRIFHALNKSQWKSFVQMLAVRYGAEEGLVDLLNPGIGIFGLQVVDNEVSVYRTATHMNFTQAYGNYWFGQSFDVQPVTYSSPSQALTLPQDEGSAIIEGQLEPRDINRKLAQAIDDRQNLSLPEKFRRLL